MLRASAIALLIAMGLITNQLPLLWLSYSTAQAEYAIENCESPDTSCHGSCTMDRDFVESTEPASEGGQDPVTVIETETNLFPYVVPHTNLCLAPYHEVLLCMDRRTYMAPQYCAIPTPPPPRT